MKKQLTLCSLALAVFSQASFAEPPKKPHFSKFINKFDTNGDQQVTKEEFDAAMIQRFTKMDADGDGVVSKEEFKKNTKERNKKYKKRNKAKLDTNNDGLVSKQEYLDAKLKRAEKKFDRLDKDQDGFLSKQELAKKKSRSKRSAHYFPKIDTNGNGVIEPEENKASSERMFSRLDTNNDNVITQDEIAAMVEKHKK